MNLLRYFKNLNVISVNVGITGTIFLGHETIVDRRILTF